MDDKSFVLIFAQHLRQKTFTGVALFAEHPSLAHAGIYQQSEGKREVGFAREILEALRTTILGQREIIFGQAVHDLSVLVPDRRQDVDHFDLDRHGGNRLVRRIGGGNGAVARLAFARGLRHGRADSQHCDRAQDRETVEAELHLLAFLKALQNGRPDGPACRETICSVVMRTRE